MDHGSVDQREMYLCHTNQIGSTIKQQSNFLLLPIKLTSLAYVGVFAINTCHTRLNARSFTLSRF